MPVTGCLEHRTVGQYGSWAVKQCGSWTVRQLAVRQLAVRPLAVRQLGSYAEFLIYLK